MNCPLCGNPVPIFGCVLWCDSCIEEYLAKGGSMDEFIAAKRAESMTKESG
jgi:hypothetical protein